MKNVTSLLYESQVGSLSLPSEVAVQRLHQGEGRGASFPCLYSNNSTEEKKDSFKQETILALCGVLSSYRKRSAETLYSNVKRLIDTSSSLGHVGFLTLTFPDNVTDHKESYKRFRSFNSHYLAPSPHFGEWVCVKERQSRGAWHYHLVIQVSHDLRSGFNFEEIEKGNYRSANSFLRMIWRDLRENLPKYGFGRSELLPVKSNQDAMARYIGKYISKGIGSRTENDRGVRLVNYSKGWIKNSVKFQWNTDGSKEWRRKLSLFARLQGCADLYDLSQKLGSDWAYKYAEEIYSIDQTIIQNKCDLTRIPFDITPSPYMKKLHRTSSCRLQLQDKKKLRTCPTCENKAHFIGKGFFIYCSRCGDEIF